MLLTATQAPPHGVQGGALRTPMEALGLRAQLCGAYVLPLASRVSPGHLPFPSDGEPPHNPGQVGTPANE